MLFRRVKNHIKNEDWFSVFVDLIIVVVGVYIGIEVSNWNEDRQESERASIYLERIRSDLVSDVQDIDDRVSYWSQVLEYGVGAIEHAENGILVENSIPKTIVAYYQASQTSSWLPNDSTFQELNGAGDLRLIRDDSLVASLSEHYVGIERIEEIVFRVSPKYREHIRGITPWKVQQFIWANCVTPTNTLVQDCDLPIDMEDGQSLLKLFANDPVLIQEARFWMTNLAMSKNTIENKKTSSKQLIEDIDRVLNRLR